MQVESERGPHMQHLPLTGLYTAGTFKLDLHWKPLFLFLHSKFNGMEHLAKKKEISLTIRDETVCSQEGVQNYLQAATGVLNEWNLVEGTVTPSPSCRSQAIPLIELYACQTVEGFKSVASSMAQSINKGPLKAALAEVPFVNAYLNVDQGKIDQVIRNLIQNAVCNQSFNKSIIQFNSLLVAYSSPQLKFTPAQGTVKIRLSCGPLPIQMKESLEKVLELILVYLSSNLVNFIFSAER